MEYFADDSKRLSLKELCDELSISIATGRNWLRLGKLIPQYTDKNSPYFSKDYATTLKGEIKSGKNQALKSRRNKKFVSGHAFYHSYVSEHCKNLANLEKLLRIVEEEKIELDIDVIQYIVADCALHLLSEKLNICTKERNCLLYQYLKGEMEVSGYHLLIDALIADKKAALTFCHRYEKLFYLDYIFEANEDILGLIYISCKNAANRKAGGLYYTPTKVVKALISNLDIGVKGKILDPGCGTGNFLLQLPESVPFDHIYGNDIDEASIKIARLNMALKFPHIRVEDICNHVTSLDYLSAYHETGFEYIIGNPPWGYDFSEHEQSKLKKNYKTAAGKTIESYDLFVERALSDLNDRGQLSFVLPEAILNVKAHTKVREVILGKSSVKSITYLGNAFDGVQCPCVMLQIMRTDMPFSTVGIQIKDGNRSFEIRTERAISPKGFSFTSTDLEYGVLEKIKNTSNVYTLAGNASFALGIVTGNNRKYISSQKTAENERVLKGSNIKKYHINPTENYIVFQPERFQQVAAAELYREPEKLLYRFICSQLVFAYDDKRTLTLNSCNILIPRLKGAKIKYILAVLNASVAQFIYQKEFNSLKVLRSHIERIPIPMVSESVQDEIIAIVDLLIQGMDAADAKYAYDKLDQLIFNLYQLTPSEQEVIKSSVGDTGKFLT